MTRLHSTCRRLAWATGLCCGIAPAAADTLESVEKTLIELGEKVTSLEFKSSYTATDSAGGVPQRSEGTGTYEYTKKGDRAYYRADSTYKTVTTQGGQQRVTEGSSLTVFDGEFMYIYSIMNGQKSVIKQRPAQPMTATTNKAYFDGLRMAYNLKLLADDTVDGRAVYVIEGTPKQQTPGMAARERFYFDKKTGVNLRSIRLDASDKTLMESRVTELKVNSSIDPDRFVFHAPPGVTVTDLTGTQPGATQTTQPPAGEAQPDRAGSGEGGETTEDKPDEGEKKEKKKSWKPKLPKFP